MSLRKHKAFRAIGYGLAGLALLSFALRVAQKALGGEWLEGYYSAKLVNWTYGSAFVALAAFALAAAIAGGFWLYQRIRRGRYEGLEDSKD